MSGEKANLNSFWSGRWSSIWQVAVESGSATISGDIKVKLKLRGKNCDYLLAGVFILCRAMLFAIRMLSMN